MTGVGVSDSHDNDVGWSRGPNNFITWALAESPSELELIEALRAGRAFFGDPTRFSGRMDVEVEGRARMGQVLVTGDRASSVRYRVDGLRPGQRVVLIHDGEVSAEFSPAPGHFETGETIGGGQSHFVRFEVREGGEPVALSNPIYLLHESPAGGVPSARRP